MPWEHTIGAWPASKELLEQLFVKERRSFSEIADLFGTTRNAVAGRCQRLGIASGDGLGGHVAAKRKAEARQGHEPMGCRWIEGDTSEKGWSYCQAAPRHRSSYCDRHHARVFTK